MQSKGAIRLVAILIALACLYQLSFTWATRHQEGKAKAYAEKAVQAEQSSPSFNSISDLDKAFYLDSLRAQKERFYIDSITAEKVYLGFTYKEIKEKEINLRKADAVKLQELRLATTDAIDALHGYVRLIDRSLHTGTSKDAES